MGDEAARGLVLNLLLTLAGTVQAAPLPSRVVLGQPSDAPPWQKPHIESLLWKGQN